MLGHAEVLALHDPESGKEVGRYTTRTVREQERTALADAVRVARGRHRVVPTGAQEATLAGRSLREDQRAAFEHAVAGGGLKIIDGRAGTGKSWTLQAVREAHERDGRTVLGLAPTNAVAQDLKTEGFAEAATAHSALFRLKNGLGEAWTARTVVIVDEAAMLDARVTGELLHEARRSRAKVILAGDDRQLASIERGGLFSELRQRHGSAVITTVTRQRVDWQRQAARDLAEGQVEDALRAFARHQALHWSSTQEEAGGALVARWARDSAEGPSATRFVLAYTNADVDRLNVSLRQVRKDRGELGEEHRFETRHRAMDFAVGDRVQLTATLKRAGLYNGQAGLITAIDSARGIIHARLDGPVPGKGREIAWSVAEFQGFRHGYAGTIYKGQGRTLDHTYLYHSHHWRQTSSYVALTRQRESAHIFVATETARDVSQLARQMGRAEMRSASVAWATRDELPPALRVQAETAAAPTLAPAAKTTVAPTAVRMDDHHRPADRDWLIAPRVSPDGRDSLGRGLDAASIAAVVAGDRSVQKEATSLANYLAGAYRDPVTARARLEALVARDGPTSAARRLAADPAQLGALHGRVGLFAGAAAKRERVRALDVAAAVSPGVARLGEARAAVEQGYRRSVEAQIKADATGVPVLSATAQTAILAVREAGDGVSRAEAWRKVRADQAVDGELKSFMAAVTGRFGEEGMRAILRAAATGRMVDGNASIAPEQREKLGELTRLVATVRDGERAAATETARLAEAERVRMGMRMGLKP